MHLQTDVSQLFLFQPTLYQLEYAIPTAFVLGFLFSASIILIIIYRSRASFLQEPIYRTIFEQPTLDTANQAAKSRRMYIENMLKEEERYLNQEIVEPVPGIDVELREISRREADAQKIGLRWQLKDDEFLLLGRVMDALNMLARRVGLLPGQIASKVKLVADRTNKGRYQVIIETLVEDFIEAELAAIASWLGISVAVQAPIEATYFGKGLCKLPGGKAGWIGGGIAFDESRYLVTCSHVIFDGCRSLFDRSPLISSTYEPDAALLKTSATNCFRFEDDQTTLVNPLSENAVTLIKDDANFWIHARSRKGQVEGIVSWVTYSGRTHIFPHVLIKSNINVFMDLVSWPPWANNFSKEGDSGSWVISTRDRWLGMLVAGSQRHHLSYVVLGEPLVDYLETRFVNTSGQSFSHRSLHMEKTIA